MNAPRISDRLLVVTPTLGQSEYLARSVALVVALPFAVRHVIAVPNPMVAEVRARYPHALVVPDTGRAGGIYGAINAALAAIDEEWDWFTYINDDDELGPGFATMFERHCSRQQPEPVAYGDVRVIDEQGDSVSFLTTERNPRYLPALLQQGISPLNQQGLLLRRDVVRKLGQFDLRYRLCADLDFWARAYVRGFTFRYHALEVGRFRIRAGQLSGDVLQTQREQSAIVARAFPRVRPALVRLWAKWRYRFCNLPRYLARSRQVGWKTSYAMLATEARAAE